MDEAEESDEMAALVALDEVKAKYGNMMSAAEYKKRKKAILASFSGQRALPGTPHLNRLTLRPPEPSCICAPVAEAGLPPQPLMCPCTCSTHLTAA